MRTPAQYLKDLFIFQLFFLFLLFVQNVESFLYKDVNVVITGNRDALTDITASSKKVKGHDVAQRPGTPRAPVSVD